MDKVIGHRLTLFLALLLVGSFVAPLAISGDASAAGLKVTYSITPTTVNVGQSVSFTCTVTSGTAPYTFLWIFGDGNTGTLQNTSYAYSTAGTYAVTLLVHDSIGNRHKTLPTTVTVNIAPLSVTGTATPTTTYATQSVSFTSSPSGGIAPYTYSWTFGDGGTSTSQNSSHAYIAAGVYTVTVTVTDSASNAAQWTTNITVSSVHAPILINGNSQFNNALFPSNGVVSGSGTASDPYIIEGWNINASTANGIFIENTNAYFIVRDCYIHDGGSSYNGIFLYNSVNGVLDNNTCSNNVAGIGLDASSNDTLINNVMIGDGIEIYGTSLPYWNTYDIETSNTVNGKPVYYYKNQSGITVPAGAGEVILANCTDSIVENQNLSHGSVGIELGFSAGITVTNNNASDNRDSGISLYSSNNNTISNNNCSNNYWDGILLWSSNNNTISNNTGSNDWDGIGLNMSSDNTISNNNASDNRDSGISLYSSNNNTISNNNCSNDYWDGIHLRSSNNNTMSNNNCSNNVVGVGLDVSSNNVIWNNTFINKHIQAYDAGTNNSWNASGSPHGYGNWWSDWQTPDILPPLGIVDIPYRITGSAGAEDYYPLTIALSVSGTASPTSGISPLNVSFTCSASKGTGLYTYSWTFGDGGTSTLQNPSHTYSVGSMFTAIVTVTDTASHAARWTSTAITVKGIVNVTGTATPTTIEVGQSVSFTATPSGGIAPYTYSWTFGDGGTSTSQNSSHAYIAAGVYTVTVTVTDSASNAAQWTTNITVSSVHAPILINGNSQFNNALFPSNGVVSGSGTASDPYIIEGWDINASAANGIEIENTNAFFIVRDTHIYDGSWSYSGIYLFNSTNGALSNNSCSNNYAGIGLNKSSDNAISWNQLFNNIQYGVRLDSRSSNNAINNNTFINNYIQAYDAGTNNSWNASGSPHGYGNYWSDWTTPDNVAPFGIVDNPYSISGSAGAQDYYPLAFPSNMDKSPPHTNLSISGTLGSNGWYIADVAVYLNASDSVSGVNRIEYSTDGGPWLVYNGPISIISDGQHDLSYYSIDIAGNIEPVNTATFKVDATSPSGSISIQNGSAFVNVTSVTLSLAATAASGIDMVRYSNDGITWSAWESFSAYKDWSLLSGDGVKTVYYQVMDNAGLNSTLSDTIILDTTSPTGSITIDSGAMYANTISVTLTLTGSDATSGVDQMRFSNNDATWSAWQAFSTSTSWTLSSGDGLKTVYYQIMDSSSNVKTYNDTIVLDTTAPTGSIVIDSGAMYANTPFVTLTLNASDATSGVAQMRFSNDNSKWSAWMAFSSSTFRTMASVKSMIGDGTKTVYVQFMDAAGNPSPVYNDTIILDTTPPALAFGIASGSNFTGSSTTLNWSATDANGIVGYEYSLDGAPFVSYGLVTQIDLTNLTAGSHNLTVRAIDGAGNIAEKKLQFNTVVASRPMGPSESSMGGLVPWLLVIIAISAIMLLLFFLLRRKEEEEESSAEAPPAPPRSQ